MIRMADRCSVALKCSSEGMECAVSDRACQDKAIAKGLEVACDVPREGQTIFVYCPSITAQHDSAIVWILLVVAFGVATIGGTLVWLALKKRDA